MASAAPISLRRGHPDDQGSARPPGRSRGWQHAGLWEESLPYEVEAVVSYMASLRPEGEPAARDSTFPAVPQKQEASSNA